jgi:rod shape-determining protein MreD
MSTTIKFILNFIVVLTIQIFILNDIMLKSSLTFFGFPVFTPIIYPLILLVMPVNTPHWFLMILGFITGLTMDMFSNTPGMHAAAMVLICYLRPFILKLFFQQTAKELRDTVPSLYKLGFTSFIIYVGFTILIHHAFFYILEIWSFKSSVLIFFKTIVSAIMSILLILLSQLLFAKKEIQRA